MGTKSGFDCEFVNKICKDVQTECSICLHVLREPHIVEPCCGHRFCRACLAEIKMATDYACPLCRKPTFKDIPDRQLKRVLMAKRVYCSFRRNGCEWKGELCKLETHLNSNPQTDRAAWQEGCSYVEIPCPLCQRERMKRLVIEEHIANECPKREVSCKFCQVHHSAYENIGKHHAVCPCVPVECPKGCRATPLRGNLASHLEYKCLNNPQLCPFHIVGCKKKFAGHRMDAHLWSTLTAHLYMVEKTLESQQKKATERGWLIHSLDEEVKVKNCEIALLRDKVASLHEEAKGRERQLMGLNADLTQLKKEIKAKDEKVASLQEGFQVCKRKLQDQAHVHVAEIDRLKVQLKEKKISLEELEKKSASVDEAMRQNTKLLTRVSAQKAEIRLLQDKCGLKSELHGEKGALQEATRRINALEEMIGSQKGELNEKAQQIDNLQEVVRCQKKDIDRYREQLRVDSTADGPTQNIDETGVVGAALVALGVGIAGVALARR